MTLDLQRPAISNFKFQMIMAATFLLNQYILHIDRELSPCVCLRMILSRILEADPARYESGI